MAKKPRKAKLRSAKRTWVESMLETWADAAGKNDCDMLGIDEAPEWVFNALIECSKIVFPGGLPPRKKWDAEFLGIFLGRINALGRLLGGEVPLGPETKADMEKITALVKNQPPPKNLKAMTKDVATCFDETRKAISIATAKASYLGYAEERDFHKGLQRGIQIGPDELATSGTFQRHTRTFWILALYWRWWVRCRSVREIYDHLCKAVGEEKIGSFKTFENHVAKKIGLKIRGRGRPRAA